MGQVLGLGGQVLGLGLGGHVLGLGLGLGGQGLGLGLGLDPSGLGLGICGLDSKSGVLNKLCEVLCVSLFLLNYIHLATNGN